MKKSSIIKLVICLLALAGIIALCVTIHGPTTTICADCEGTGVVDGVTCEVCGGEKFVEQSMYQNTFVALIPPIIAIGLALITKEVYSSLFIGILAGALFSSNFNPVGTLNKVVQDGLIGSLADSWNVGILIFLVLLGILVALVNKSGGSASFGAWAQKHIKTKVGAQIAVFVLGVLIFVDDYFNCLTVGSVMRPLSDSHKISRAKLAYLIDATAAPICMIAPVSSWAAAVAGVVKGQDGFSLFVSAIPYNFYSLLTITMIIAITFMKFDYGPMRRHEMNALKGDLFTEGEKNEQNLENDANTNGKVIDLVLPVIVLIVCCIAGMIYTGGFFDAGADNQWNFIQSFADCDASIGLSYGGLVAVLISIVYLLIRGVVSFTDAMDCIRKGFIAMVSPILILTLAWTLNGMTSNLGAADFVSGIMSNSAAGLSFFLPAIIFLVAVGLSFATGTSWGTFGILLPIVVAVFAKDGTILTIGISACLAGAVCGDHCSPISDTTIMASAGAQCNHVNHVSTQLPYALTVAGVSLVCYVIAGFIRNWLVVLPLGIALMVLTLFVIKFVTKPKDA